MWVGSGDHFCFKNQVDAALKNFESLCLALQVGRCAREPGSISTRCENALQGSVVVQEAENTTEQNAPPTPR